MPVSSVDVSLLGEEIVLSSVVGGNKQVGAGVLDLDQSPTSNFLHTESTVRGKHKLPLKEYALCWGGVGNERGRTEL